LNALAWAYATDNRDLGEALELALNATKLDPQWAYWDTLAEVYLARGEYEESRKANETARAAAQGNEEATRQLDERASRLDALEKR
jgi:hypothetical protein